MLWRYVRPVERRRLRMGGILFVSAALLALAHPAAAGPWMANTQTLAMHDPYQLDPVVSYDSVDDEYLVVWQEDDSPVSEIYGVRVDTSGMVIGIPFLISSSSGHAQQDPDVAYDFFNNQYLVVWSYDYSDGDLDIKAVFIPGASTTVSTEFWIDDSTATSEKPAVVFNPADIVFDVVYETGSVFTLRTVAADGSGMGDILTISGTSSSSWEPDITWNQAHSQLLLTYECMADSDGWVDLCALRLTSYASTIGSEIIVALHLMDCDISPPVVASCRGSSLIPYWTWDGATSEETMEAKIVHFDGSMVSVGQFGIASTVSTIGISCSESAGEYLVTWDRAFEGSGYSSYGIVGAFVDTEGHEGDPFIIYATPDNFYYTKPSVAYGSRGKALVAWQSDRPPSSDTTDIRGRLVGNRIFADNFESGNDGYWIPSP